MNKLLKLNLIGILLFVASCTTMSPLQVHNTLPTLTKSKYVTQSELETTNCKSLTKGRSFVAPIGMTAKNDLANAAKGIDEWVKIDGGNAYLLKSFNWVNIDKDTNQLHVDFDTLLCE